MNSKELYNKKQLEYYKLHKKQLHYYYANKEKRLEYMKTYRQKNKNFKSIKTEFTFKIEYGLFTLNFD